MTTVKRKPPLSAKFDILRFLCSFKVQVWLNIMIYNTYMFPLHFMSLFVAIISELRQFYVGNVIL